MFAVQALDVTQIDFTKFSCRFYFPTLNNLANSGDVVAWLFVVFVSFIRSSQFFVCLLFWLSPFVNFTYFIEFSFSCDAIDGALLMSHENTTTTNLTTNLRCRSLVSTLVVHSDNVGVLIFVNSSILIKPLVALLARKFPVQSLIQSGSPWNLREFLKLDLILRCFRLFRAHCRFGIIIWVNLRFSFLFFKFLISK